MKIDMTSFLSAEGGPIWIKFCRLVQNDMSTVVIWQKSTLSLFATRQYTYTKVALIKSYKITQNCSKIQYYIKCLCRHVKVIKKIMVQLNMSQ